MQRAICRALDGLPMGELWDDPDVREAFGHARPPLVMPAEFVILAGIRTAKSLISAVCAFRASQMADMSELRPGEPARVSVLSVDKDKAGVIFDHLKGTLSSQPKLRPFLLRDDAETLYLRHPSGRVVEVVITAGKRAGASLVGRWMAGVIFDEAPRMVGADDGVVNLEDSRRAVLGRMLPGAQILYPGSPWAPMGPVYEWATELFGKPTPEMVVVRGTGRMLNPSYWTEERCERLKRQDPFAYRTDALGQFADPETQLFGGDEVDEVLRETDDVIEPRERHHYTATMDPATRSNAWTLTIWTCTGLGGRSGLEPCYSVDVAKQWVPQGAPLSPRQVLIEIADTIAPYGIDNVYTDQYSVDALADIAAHLPAHPDGSQRHLELYEENTNQRNRYEGIKTLHLLVQDKRLSLPRIAALRNDLLGIKRRVTTDGVKFVLPRTRDGRHADFVPALSLGTTFPPAPPLDPEPKVDRGLAAAIARIDSPADPMLGALSRLTGAKLDQ